MPLDVSQTVRQSASHSKLQLQLQNCVTYLFSKGRRTRSRTNLTKPCIISLFNLFFVLLRYHNIVENDTAMDIHEID